MKLRNVLLAHASMGLALLSAPQLASASNNYPGLACVPLSGTVHPDSDGHIENTGAAVATVLCPVTVDAATSGLATSGTPTAFVTDQNFDTNVCCSSRVKNTGQSVISGGTACSTGTNAAAQGLTLTNPDAGGFTFTHRWLQCDLPPVFGGQRSEVRTYRY
ncbi:MAG: hypothetical protein ABIY55_11905 [Kofleriaceae bacterium]